MLSFITAFSMCSFCVCIDDKKCDLTEEIIYVRKNIITVLVKLEASLIWTGIFLSNAVIWEEITERISRARKF
jgi:hypothetical protein